MLMPASPNFNKQTFRISSLSRAGAGFFNFSFFSRPFMRFLTATYSFIRSRWGTHAPATAESFMQMLGKFKFYCSRDDFHLSGGARARSGAGRIERLHKCHYGDI